MDPDAELRAFAMQETGYLRAKLQALRPMFQAAAPGSRRADVDAVTPEELATALEVIRRVRPLSLSLAS